MVSKPAFHLTVLALTLPDFRESGAIITYLVDKYDTEHKISVADPNEKYKQLQWLFFQASGQGPYFGQYVWFLLYHPGEKIPSAIERYKAEVKRVWGVLNDVLSKQDWLVGDKLTVADLALFMWVSLRVVEGETSADRSRYLAGTTGLLAC